MADTYRDRNRAHARKAIRDWRRAPRGTAYPHWIRSVYDPMASTPAAWNHWQHVEPARAEVRQKLVRVMDDPQRDDGNWPDYKRPHIYYW